MSDRTGPEDVIQMVVSLGAPGEAREKKLGAMREVLRELTSGTGRVPDWWEDLWDLVYSGAL